jgi:hypothetical protein
MCTTPDGASQAGFSAGGNLALVWSGAEEFTKHPFSPNVTTR